MRPMIHQRKSGEVRILLQKLTGYSNVNHSTWKVYLQMRRVFYNFTTSVLLEVDDEETTNHVAFDSVARLRQ